MNKQRLFLASCVALVTTAVVFAIRGDVEAGLSASFHLSKEQVGVVWGPAFYCFTAGIFICGLLVDLLGMRRLLTLSGLGYLASAVLLWVAPRPTGPVESVFSEPGPALLYVAFALMGLSQGIVEGVINPLVATIYSDQKTKKLNFLHAWWPGGLVIGGLAVYAMTKLGVRWEIKIALLVLPAVAYLVMIFGQEFPKTERVASNVSTGEMAKQALHPLFLLLVAMMFMTAATELGPDQWFPSIMKNLTGIEGVLFLVYSGGLMWLLRFFLAGLAHKASPFGLLAGCSVLCAIGLYWLGSLQPGTSPAVAFLAATVFAVGKTYYWPTMLGVTSERFPKGGALLMNLIGGAGMLSIAIVLPIMGEQFDKLGPGAALKTVAVLPVVLVVLFTGLLVAFRAKGGYRAVQLQQEREPRTAPAAE